MGTSMPFRITVQRSTSSIKTPTDTLAEVPMPLSPTPAQSEALLADLLVTHAPADTAERHWVEEIAHAMWRRRRLHALEARVMAGLLAAEDEAPAARLPSLG